MDRSPSPYGLEIIQSCLTCPAREDHLFCHLGPEALARLESIRQTSVYPKGAVLFVEGQPCRGLFILCSGKVKLSTSSSQGRSMIVGIAETGEVLGLSAAMSEGVYAVNAHTLEPTQVNFIPREEFLHFLQEQSDVAYRVARQLSLDLRRAYQQVSRIALAPTARAKLIGLLLEWGEREPQAAGKARRFQLRLTHEEVGEMIGSSRETVTRLLNDLRRRGLIQIKGAQVVLPDPARLAALLS